MEIGKWDEIFMDHIKKFTAISISGMFNEYG